MPIKLKTIYLVDGKRQVETLEEVNKILKDEWVTIQDITQGITSRVEFIYLNEKKGVYEKMAKKVVGGTPVVEEDLMDEQDLVNQEVNDTDAATTEEDNNAESSSDEVTADELLETLPQFESLEELKDFIKDIDTPTLEFMASTLGAEWKESDNDPINRMRVAMSLHRHFFPEMFKPKEEGKKKKTRYSDLDTEELFNMAKGNSLEVKRTGNDPIDRMRVIMKLKEAGLLPQ